MALIPATHFISCAFLLFVSDAKGEVGRKVLVEIEMEVRVRLLGLNLDARVSLSRHTRLHDILRRCNAHST